MITLFSSQTTNATSTAAIYSGGTRIIQAYGTFGGGTITLECSANGSNYTAIDGSSFTAAGARLITLTEGCWVRAVLAGSTGATVNVDIS